jgi:hypothetical protein
MAYFTEYDHEEGKTVIRVIPSKLVQSLPVYDCKCAENGRECNHTVTWKKFLASRPDRYVLKGGEAKLTCLGCGELASKLKMGDIVVGGLIRMSYREPRDHDTLIERTRVMAVTKAGLGCMDCVGEYVKAQSQVAAYNRSLEKVAGLRAKLAVAQGNCDNRCHMCHVEIAPKAKECGKCGTTRLAKVKLPVTRSAWINVLRVEGTEGAETT